MEMVRAKLEIINSVNWKTTGEMKSKIIYWLTNLTSSSFAL